MRILLFALLFNMASGLLLSAQDTLIIKEGFVLLGKDTLNKTDDHNMKQERWIEFQRTSLLYDLVDNINTTNHIINESEYVLTNVLEPENYIITMSGKYKNNKKEGIWQSFYKGGGLWKKVKYKKGKIVGNFYFFYENGNPKIVGIEKSDSTFLVKTFDEKNYLLNERRYKIEEIQNLF